jgi:hypothetical protein
MDSGTLDKSEIRTLTSVLALKLRFFGEGCVQISHVGIVMFAMVNFHCGNIDVRFECVSGIGEGGEGVAHEK